MAIEVQLSGTGTNGTDIDALTPEVGGSWTKVAGNIEVQNNRLYCQAGPALAVSPVTPSAADYDVGATFNRVSGTGSTTYILGRRDGSGNFYYARVTTADIVLGEFTSPSTFSTKATYASGDGWSPSTGVDYDVVLRFEGADITVLLDGAPILTANDATLSGAGGVGIFAPSSVSSANGWHVSDFYCSVASAEALPALGTLTATGFAPTIQTPRVVTAALGVLLATGFAPTVTASNHVSVAPAVGALVATGYAPTVSVSNNVSVAPGVGVATATGYAPTVATPRVVLPGVGVLTATGFAPTIATPRMVTPGAGAMLATGFAPDVLASSGAGASPDVGALVATGYAPTITTPQSASPGVGLLVATGYAPTVSVSTPSTGVSEWLPYGILGGGALALLESPEAGSAADVAPSLGVLIATGYAPTATATNHVSATPDVGALVAAGFAPTVTTPVVVAPGVGVVAATGFAPTIAVAGVGESRGFCPTLLLADRYTPRVLLKSSCS